MKHLAIQSAFLNICERKVRPKELAEFEQQFHLWNFFPTRCSKKIVTLQNGSVKEAQQLSPEVLDNIKLQSWVAECRGAY